MPAEAASAARAASGDIDIDLAEHYTVMTAEEWARKEAEEGARWASQLVTSQAYSDQDLQPDSCDEEPLSAAPAARQDGRLPFRGAVGAFGLHELERRRRGDEPVRGHR